MEIISVANFLQFDDLKKDLGQIVEANVSVDTVLPLYVHSDTHDLHEVKKKCLKCIEEKSNPAKILKSESFLKLPEKYVVNLISKDTFVAPECDILEAVVRWKEYNERSTEEMKDITQQIRLSRFSTQEIFIQVEPTGLFREEDIFESVRVLNIPNLSLTQPRGRNSKLTIKCERIILFCKYLSWLPPYPHNYVIMSYV